MKLPRMSGYRFTLRSSGALIDLSNSLAQQGFQEAIEIELHNEMYNHDLPIEELLDNIIDGKRCIKPIDTAPQYYLLLPDGNIRFNLDYTPSIIGRRDPENPEYDEMLGIDLSDVESGKYVSRQHACVTKDSHEFRLHLITERDYVETRVDGKLLGYLESTRLELGNEITIGETTLLFIKNDIPILKLS